MSQHKSISYREGSPIHTVADDGLLERLNSSKDKQRTSKDVKKTFKLQNITTPKKKPTKETQAIEQHGAPRKAITSSKKTPIKRKLVLRDEIDVSKSESELEYMPLSRKNRTPRDVIIQKPSSFLKKLTQESSDKLKRIAMLSKAPHKGSGLRPGVPDELEWKSRISDEGAGTKPEVLDEKEYKSDSDDDFDKWGSTDEEDNDEVDEEDKEYDDDEEDEDDDNRRFDITNTDDERTDSNKESQGLTYSEAGFKENAEDKEEPKEPEVISMMDVQMQQEVPLVQQETYPVVSRFAEMEGFVKELNEADFSAAIYDSIKAQVPSIINNYLGSSLLDEFCKVLRSNNVELKKELSELDYKKVIDESGKAHVTVKALAMNEEINDDSVKAHVMKQVKNFLPHLLPKAVSDFAIPMIEESVKAHVVTKEVIEESVKAHVVNEVKNFMPQYLQDALKKTPISRTQSSSSHQFTIEAANMLLELELKNILYHKMHQSGSSAIEEPVFEMGTNNVVQTFNMNLDDVELPSPSPKDEHPSPNADVDQPSPVDDTNPEGYDRLVDISKRLLLIEKEGRLSIHVEVFFNNIIEYLNWDKAERTYCPSITKMPATRYMMEGIEDLVPDLWSSSLTVYDKDALLGIKH
nr:hypothetical protein [Tanacetum cinerariifolium]